MKRNKHFFLTILMLFSGAVVFGQGIIRGTVIEDATGEPLFGVTTVIQGTTTGASTDFDGKFEIKTAPGTYNLQISFISFKTVTIENLEVKGGGEVTLVNNIRLKEDSEVLEEVVVTAEALQTTENALLTVKRKSVNLFDGISSASFKKIGDSDAAAAVKRVPGISIEGGKYVYVRGLGDRYTKTVLNGMDIPGLDPDRNTLQMDIFPTNVIDNIIVVKAFTPDLPADFTGGVVDISLKDFPDEKTMNVSWGVGYTPGMHLNSDFLAEEESSTDIWGYDNGMRDIPTAGLTEITTRGDVFRDSGKQEKFTEIAKKFNPNLSPDKKQNFVDYSLGLNFGNQIAGDKNTWGYNAALAYKKSTTFYKDAEFNFYGKPNDRNKYELVGRNLQKGNLGTKNVLLSGLFGLALKRAQAKYRLNALHLQNGESKAGILKVISNNQGSNFTANQYNLEYSQRALTNFLLAGTHYNKDATFEVEWKLSPTFSAIKDPDIRFTRIRTDSKRPSVGTEVGLPERHWRYLSEVNYAGKIDFTKKFGSTSKDPKLKFGGSYTLKNRAYRIENFAINTGDIKITNNPDDLFKPEHFFHHDNNFGGLFYEPKFIPTNENKYDATITNIGAYSSFEFNLMPALKAILGVRAEKYVQYYTGQQDKHRKLDNKKMLDDFDFFPSVNFIYALSEQENAQHNLRFSFSRTIARPSFKESSISTIIDPISQVVFLGGFIPQGNTWKGELKSSHINNFDLRWEMFQPGGQTVSLSAFFKSFESPIEIVQIVEAKNNVQPRNVGNGTVMGLEFELRQNLGKIASSLENFNFNTNITFVRSKIKMSDAEYASRKANTRKGESIESSRKMAGQAPYIINAGLSYKGAENALECGLYYNVQGETLLLVGLGDRTDAYSVPFHSLNLTVNKSFGAEKRLKLGLKIGNLLGQKKQKIFKSYQAKDAFLSRMNPGTSFGISLGYRIW